MFNKIQKSTINNFTQKSSANSKYGVNTGHMQSTLNIKDSHLNLKFILKVCGN
jgi:hypothetical protein